MIGIIAAVTKNGVIGVNGQLPFNYSEDMKHFKATTTSSIVIMGRKTFESIGKPLPKRRNIVISSKTIDVPGVETYSSVKEAMIIASAQPAILYFDEFGNERIDITPIWLCGGASIYEAGMDYADKIVLTLTPDLELSPAAVKFPWINPLKFDLKSIEPLNNINQNNLFIATYIKVK
jgi:dihydrofolate reductase